MSKPDTFQEVSSLLKGKAIAEVTYSEADEQNYCTLRFAFTDGTQLHVNLEEDQCIGFVHFIPPYGWKQCKLNISHCYDLL